MNDGKDIITNLYDTLLQLRYPHITNVELKDVETKILSGENRICLLSWFLTEKSLFISTQLEKLKDTVLEDKLFKYYSEIGICNDKNVLLGKCSLKQQLPTLRLLLDFIKKVYLPSFVCSIKTEETPMESFVCPIKTEETPMDIIKLYINDDNEMSSPSIKPKVNYSEAIKYFEEYEKQLKLDEGNTHIKLNMSKDSSIENDNKLADKEEDMFDKEKEKFIKAFKNISSWPVPPRNFEKDVTDSICTNIKSICSDFPILKKVLQANNDLSNVNLPERLSKTSTPLNEIIEDIVIFNEQLEIWDSK